MESCGTPNSFYHPQYGHKGIIKSIQNWRFMALDYHTAEFCQVDEMS